MKLIKLILEYLPENCEVCAWKEGCEYNGCVLQEIFDLASKENNDD